MNRRPPNSPLFPSTTPSRSRPRSRAARRIHPAEQRLEHRAEVLPHLDRKSTRLNSSHLGISDAVFCLKKKKNKQKLVLSTLILTDRDCDYLLYIIRVYSLYQ